METIIPRAERYDVLRKSNRILLYFFARQCGEGEAVSGIPRAERHEVLRKNKQNYDNL